jgi:hypothetical protein
MKNAVFWYVSPCRCCEMKRCSSETSVYFTGSIRRHIPEDDILIKIISLLTSWSTKTGAVEFWFFELISNQIFIVEGGGEEGPQFVRRYPGFSRLSFSWRECDYEDVRMFIKWSQCSSPFYATCIIFLARLFPMKCAKWILSINCKINYFTKLSMSQHVYHRMVGPQMNRKGPKNSKLFKGAV